MAPQASAKPLRVYALAAGWAYSEKQINGLIDIQAANVDVRARQKEAITRGAAALCGATSVHAFLNAVEWWQDATTEIDRKGFCLACGGVLVAETMCAKCG
ncbi:MAG: hypothetical protein M3Q55_02680, partial [Acidobacteriota bacterium]|nr:hypothetical protein [Acidobacteriota bacterium]